MAPVSPFPIGPYPRQPIPPLAHTPVGPSPIGPSPVGPFPRRPVPRRPIPLLARTLWQPHTPKNNLISINYYNLWLYPLNVVGGLIWIGKKIIKKFYLSLVMVYKTFLHSYTSPHIYSWIFKTLWVIIFWVRVIHKMLNVNWKKIHSIILSVTCHGLRNFPLLIHIPSKPFVNFQNPMSYYFLS